MWFWWWLGAGTSSPVVATQYPVRMTDASRARYQVTDSSRPRYSVVDASHVRYEEG